MLAHALGHRAGRRQGRTRHERPELLAADPSDGVDLAHIGPHMSLVRLARLDEALAVARGAYPLLLKAGLGPEMLEPCALLQFRRGRIDDAARIMGRGSASFAALGFRRDPVEQILYNLLHAGLRDALPADELARRMEEGRVMSDAAAMRLALDDRA